jgi:pyridoxal phosphate enzyme (YggS family)
LSPADIQDNIVSLNRRIAAACQRAGRSPSEVNLIAVSKTVEAAEMLKAYQFGVRHFGENRVQEGQRKWPLLGHLDPPPIRHFIGNLQSNKIKLALENFDIIQSLDSVDLALAVNRRLTGKYPVLLEVNIAGESSKSGFTPEAVPRAFEVISGFSNLDIQGLMTVAPITAQLEDVRPLFRKLRELSQRLKLKHLSMGMTNDFEIAIEEGATMIRIGRAIFGERD